MMPSNHLMLCWPLLLQPSIFPSIRVLSNESAIPTRWPKNWSFSFSITPSNEYSVLFPLGLTGLISLPSKGLKNLPYHHSSKASILQHPAFFMAQLSWPHMTTRKTIALTICTFISKVFSYALLFNMLFRFVIAFHPRSKHHLISWLQSPTTVILESKKMKSITVSTFSPSICHEVMGPDAMILVFWMLSFKPTYSLSSFTFFKRLFSSSSLSAFRVILSEVVDIFSQKSWFQYVIHLVWYLSWCTLPKG